MSDQIFRFLRHKNKILETLSFFLLRTLYKTYVIVCTYIRLKDKMTFTDILLHLHNAHFNFTMLYFKSNCFSSTILLKIMEGKEKIF